jgi:DNA-binding transcriptional MerR regulator
MFTVKQLSKIAGITPRTLHYYDEIGLLKPARVGENGYRYYADESLLRLQQILFYRELDIPLENIKRIMGHPDFDLADALERHKAQLYKRIDHLERLVRTVEDTLEHLKGERTMSQKQLFEAFSDEQQAEYEKEAMEMYDPAIVKASIERYKKYTPAEKKRIQAEGNAVYLALLEAMPKGPESPEAQAAVEGWRRHMDYFWTPNGDQLLALAEGYNDDPRFKATFDKIDPNLAGFIREAVKVYVSGMKR